MITIGTFCSGIGSPEQAIKDLNIPHEVVFYSEINQYARKTYEANHDFGFLIPDMTKCDYKGEKYYSDLVVAGLPCQAFSLAGKRLGELDPRGLLFYDFYKYVKQQQPKFFIIENVKGLLSDNNGETFRNWINLLGQSENGTPFFFPHEDSLIKTSLLSIIIELLKRYFSELELIKLCFVFSIMLVLFTKNIKFLYPFLYKLSIQLAIIKVFPLPVAILNIR